MRLKVVLALAAVVLMSGCASIVSGVNQPVSVVAKTTDSADVIGARCTLTNSKGEWYATTPGSVVVHRAYGNMSVNCVHAAYAGVTSVKSTTKAMAFGNIIFGGLIGVGIDIGTGSAYDYPDLIAVPMTASSPVTSPVPLALPPVASLPPLAPALVPNAQPIEIVPASPAAPVPVTPARPEPKASEGLKGGQDGFVAARLARTQACSAQPAAVMTGKGPGFETYSIACENGDALSLRCEFGNCRILR